MSAVIAKKLHDHALSQKVGPYPFLIGIVAALGMVGFYLGLLTLTSDWGCTPDITFQTRENDG